MGSGPAFALEGALSLAVAAAFGAALIVAQPSCVVRHDVEEAPSVESRCASCHGDPDRGGDFLQRAAPPRDLAGATDASYPGVGAHHIHVYGAETHAPIACAECHVVPEAVESAGHADDARPAEVILGPMARAGGLEPRYDVASRRCSDSWCHRDADAVWTAPRSSADACGSCHGLPPPAPHPQLGDCSQCHGAVVADDDRAIAEGTRHVDGIVDVTLEESCTGCHGGDNPAPPVDLSGSSSTASPGVGAHQVHLAGTPRSRAVLCGECHDVPTTVTDSGHLDSPPPAEVVFSGAAVAYGDGALYAAGSCETTSCHGGAFPEGHASGGTLIAPSWTVVDGSQAACGTCHALPPPAPHPKAELNPICSACHENIAADNATFLQRDLHVDGVVTFAVPR